jgi:hypothetical protein
MKEEWRKALAEMRHDGYAVIVWTPEELGEEDPDFVQDRSIEFGFMHLNLNQEGSD